VKIHRAGDRCQVLCEIKPDTKFRPYLKGHAAVFPFTRADLLAWPRPTNDGEGERLLERA
jgi:hypothetical protein